MVVIRITIFVVLVGIIVVTGSHSLRIMGFVGAVAVLIVNEKAFRDCDGWCGRRGEGMIVVPVIDFVKSMRFTLAKPLAVHFDESSESVVFSELAAYQRACDNYTRCETSAEAIYIKDDSGFCG